MIKLVKLYFSVGFLFLMTLLHSCSNENKNNTKNTSAISPIFYLQPEKNTLTSGDSLIIKKNPALNFTVDSIQVFWDNILTGSLKTLSDYYFITTNLPVGINDIIFKIFYNKEVYFQNIQILITSNIKPKVYSYKIISELKHDPEAFTEGLEFDNEILLESTGLNGNSELRTVDKNGNVSIKQKLEEKYFGEGITKLDNYIYQITWREHTGFVYDSSFSQFATFTIPNEGWGMTNDGKNLLRSDGSNKIYLTDKNSFATLRTIQVYDEDYEVEDLNELEFVDGYIYANVWRSDSIYKIEAATGKVIAYIDLSDLRNKIKNEDAEVLNGIAWHKQKQLFYVTGKYWDKIFAIKVAESSAKTD